MNMDAQWAAKLACRDVVEQSVQRVDDGQAQAFAELFFDDAVLVRPNGAVIEGRQAIHRAYAERPADRLTRHLLTNVVVELRPGGQAVARSYVLLWTGCAAAPESPWGRPADARQLVGEFLDQLAQAPDGQWRIRRREARFTLYRE